MPVSLEKFFVGHGMITNKFPIKGNLKDLPKIYEDSQIDTSEFGLFDVSSPDFNSFYPNLEPEDLKPNDDEYVFPLFRALSSVVLQNFGPIDFTKKGVLEAAVPLIVGQTIYNNHEQIIGNDVGVVVEATWERARTYDGVKVPSGINVRMKIDGKANPKLARSLMSDPPSVHSSSVTVLFKWEQSHKDLTRDEFYGKLGTMVDDKLVRRVASEILLFNEISLVPHGADPFAKNIQDGKIVLPQNSAIRDKLNSGSFSSDDFTGLSSYYDFKNPMPIDWASNSAEPTIPQNNNTTTNKNQNGNKMNENLLTFLRSFLKLADDATEEAVMSSLQTGIEALQETAQTAATSLSTLQEQYPEGSEILTDEQRSQLGQFEELKKFQDDILAATKKEAIKMYKLSVGGDDNADPAVLALIENGSYETITALNRQYTKQVEEKFQATCSDCGSTKITRASSANPEGGVTQPNSEEGSEAIKSNDEVMNSLARKAPASGGVHGETK